MSFINRALEDFGNSVKDFQSSSKLIHRSFSAEYQKEPVRLKVIDAFLVYAFLTVVIQFVYMLCVGTFPFNSFLSGFFCSLGFFVLLVSLRMQVDPKNKEFQGLLPQRAFADFVFCNCLLFLVVWNFMG